MWWTCAAGQAVHNLNVTGSKCWQLLNIHHLPYHQPSWTGQWKFKPVINWANVCSRTQLEVFGEPSWFLIGRTFLCKPSWKYSSKLYSGTLTCFAQHVLRTFALFDDHCLWLAESRALLWMKKWKIKMDDRVARFFTHYGGNLFICWLVGGAALSRRPRMR